MIAKEAQLVPRIHFYQLNPPFITSVDDDSVLLKGNDHHVLMITRMTTIMIRLTNQTFRKKERVKTTKVIHVV